MQSPSEPSGTVLVVEDERQTAETYERVLAADHDVRVAYGGEEALDQLDGDVDVALLDRRMPGLSGDDVLAEIQSRRDVDCRIAMVTAVSPDFDIVEMGFDDYLVKPVSVEDLETTVDRLLVLDEYDEKYRELGAKRVKRNVLEVEKNRAELDESEEFAALEARIAELEAELDEMADRYPDLPDSR